MQEPCSGNHYQAKHADLMLSSFLRLTGKPLLDPTLTDNARFQALYHAPFAVVSHNTDSDPIFNYGNKTAQALFEMNWQDFTKLPSRFSAEPQIQSERDRLLARVTQYGFIDNYQGVRISATGKRFFVSNAIVWNLLDERNVYGGQAAVLYQWSIEPQ